MARVFEKQRRCRVLGSGAYLHHIMLDLCLSILYAGMRLRGQLCAFSFCITWDRLYIPPKEANWGGSFLLIFYPDVGLFYGQFYETRL